MIHAVCLNEFLKSFFHFQYLPSFYQVCFIELLWVFNSLHFRSFGLFAFFSAWTYLEIVRQTFAKFPCFSFQFQRIDPILKCRLNVTLTRQNFSAWFQDCRCFYHFHPCKLTPRYLCYISIVAASSLN